MEIVKCPSTKENIIILNEDETTELKQMIAGASLPLRRTFNDVLVL